MPDARHIPAGPPARGGNPGDHATVAATVAHIKMMNPIWSAERRAQNRWCK